MLIDPTLSIIIMHDALIIMRLSLPDLIILQYLILMWL